MESYDGIPCFNCNPNADRNDFIAGFREPGAARRITFKCGDCGHEFTVCPDKSSPVYANRESHRVAVFGRVELSNDSPEDAAPCPTRNSILASID